jgi:hypothetical protein
MPIDPALARHFGIDENKTGIIERLTPAVTWSRRALQVFLDMKRSPFRLPWKQSVRAWSLGFSEWSYLLYDLERRDPNHFLSDRDQALKAHRILGRRIELVRDKWNFTGLLQSAQFPQPHLYGRLCGGRFFAQDQGGDSDLPRLLNSVGRLVIRPSWGGGGWGIFFLECDGQSVLVNGIPATPDQLQALLRNASDSVVTAFEQQAAYAAEIYPHSTNTLRVLVLWDDVEDRPFLAAAAHRFGSRRSGLLDNFHGGRGGLSAPIDNNGVIGAALTLGPQGQRLRYAHHPDTGALIEGVAIPDWQPLVSQLLDHVARLPFLQAVGWDLVKTPGGWSCLEGNPNPGTKVWQAHHGLLEQDRVRRFYQRHGVIT